MAGMDRWKGKVAVVTGASSGIGRGVARELVLHGLTVVVLARRLQNLQDLIAEAAVKRASGRIVAMKCDLMNEEEIKKAFRKIEADLGGVDMLVNNAGVCPISSLNEGVTAEWKAIMDTNVMALTICTREALKSMRKRGDDGQIIHMNSILGHYFWQFHGMPIGMYNASKFAVTALTEALRIELQGLKSGIKISSVSPGLVATEIQKKALEGSGSTDDKVADNEQRLAAMPMIDVQDVADAVIYIMGTRKLVQIQDLIIQPIGQRLSG